MPTTIHPTAIVDVGAVLGADCRVWHWVHISAGARIGAGCSFGQNVYVGNDVAIGDNVKIQNNVSVFAGVEIEDGVFVGPHVCFTNDKIPRAVNPDMSIKAADDWHITKTLVKAGAAIGANSTIVCGVTVGKWAMVASGSVVTKNVPDHALVMGNPARIFAWVCACGKRVQIDDSLRRGECVCGRVLVKESVGDGIGADTVRLA